MLQAIFRDIGDRKAMEEALVRERASLERQVVERTADLRSANVQLAHAARLKDEFLASMSHELRTPLNAILGRSETLLEELHGPLVPKQQRSVRSIEESGRHLLSLINDILDLSKIEAGKLELELDEIVVSSLCEASVRLIGETALKKHIAVSVEIDPAVNRMRADARRLKQMLVNLLSNAVKFTPEGGKIGLVVASDAEHNLVRFVVWDTGIGIPPEDTTKLFKPFVQLDSSLSRQYAGTGLGLSLVLRMAELHGGSVAVESAPGTGSRFTVILPWRRSAYAAAQTNPLLATGNVNARRVLMVEDSPSASEQMMHYLDERGAVVELLQQGAGVVERAAASQPDLIVLDILLPDLSGWQVLTQLRQDERTRALRVLVITVLDERQQALDMGADGYLLKPVERASFHEAVAQVLSGSVAQDGTAAPPTTMQTILLSEDNEETISMMLDYLPSKQYRVEVARNGAEAVERARAIAPDLDIDGCTDAGDGWPDGDRDHSCGPENLRDSGHRAVGAGDAGRP